MRPSKNQLVKEQPQNESLLKKLPYIFYAFFSILLIHFYINPISFSPSDNFPSTNRITISPPSSPSQEQGSSGKSGLRSTCDYTKGQWVPYNVGPSYNGTTCDTIKYGQNCMAHGRPDTDYLYWRWKPENCSLPRFDPKTFLKLLENRHVAFVGDSLARNQLESLLCMLATVSKPNLYWSEGEENKFRKWHFSPENVNISIYWSPFLVEGVEKTNERDFNTLHLESADERWTRDLGSIDMLVLSAGHWYLLSAAYYYENTLLGCHLRENCTEIGFYDVYGRALGTALDRVVSESRLRDSKTGPISIFLTTFSPAHFEGEWDKFGACSKTRPYAESEMALDGANEEMWKVGVQKVREAKSRVEGHFGNNARIEALDITKLTLLRPDGHPGPYMNPFPFANGVSERVQNDCVHWCLPGPIDTWNEILLDVIKRWESENKGER
ncbi:trichome birefringence-like [Striga asiatica]|uniref:Trichome birefringence-like n=1 Tax=Striga asiatica TaxID=4170 RepID=A0A5A7RFM6_STRAF|nr:trichome birefringence-like [Striga asiatica]